MLAGAGVAGIAFTVTTVVATGLLQPFTVTVTEYVPVAAVVAFTILGFCEVDRNRFGPVHE